MSRAMAVALATVAIASCSSSQDLGNNDAGATDQDAAALPPAIDSGGVPPSDGGAAIPIVPLALGPRHACALTRAGTVRCWGGGSNGELGRRVDKRSLVPVDVAGLPGGAVALAAGDGHTCALDRRGTVLCWGLNDVGQLGAGAGAGTEIPTAVAALDDVIAIGAGGSGAGTAYSCALERSGSVKCWGDGSRGQLGNDRQTGSTVPVAVVGISRVRALAVGPLHVCVVTDSGAVRCWGDAGPNGLGDNSLSAGIVAVTAGRGHSCALETSKVLCWGYNQDWQLGDPSSFDTPHPVTVKALTSTITSVAAGDNHVCARADGGGVWCWGSDWAGQLGDGKFQATPTPSAVVSLPPMAFVAAARDHSCARDVEGAVWCWGENTSGQLGNGSDQTSATAKPVFGLP